MGFLFLWVLGAGLAAVAVFVAAAAGDGAFAGRVADEGAVGAMLFLGEVEDVGFGRVEVLAGSGDEGVRECEVAAHVEEDGAQLWVVGWGALVDGVVHLLAPDVEGVGLGVAFAAEEAYFAEGFLCVHG